VTIRCNLCGKEFQTNAAFQQHYRDKHPDAGSPVPREVKKEREGSGRRPKSRIKSRRYRSGSKKKLLIIALPILVVGVVVSVYYSMGSSRDIFGTGIYGIKVGDTAPDIAITLTNGTTVYLSNFQPRPVLLWFVATWCTSCYETQPIINSQYYPTLNSKGVELVTVEVYKDFNQSAPAGSGVPNTIAEFAKLGGGPGKPGWSYGTSDWRATHTYDPAANLDTFYVINQYGVITMTNLVLPNYLDMVASQSYSSAPLPPFPFPCLAESTATHVHPWLRIVINGQNVTIPSAIGIKNPSSSGSCFEPLHTHDASGIIHIESATNTPSTLGDFFQVWKATYGSVMIGGSPHPIVFNPTDILGFKADSTHRIVVLVDGKPSTTYASLLLNALDYCNASATGPPCYPTAVGNPYYSNGQSYPFGSGHTIVIEYEASAS